MAEQKKKEGGAGAIIINNDEDLLVRKTGQKITASNLLAIHPAQGTNMDTMSTTGAASVSVTSLSKLLIGGLCIDLSNSAVITCVLSCDNDRLTITFQPGMLSFRLQNGVTEKVQSGALVVLNSGNVNSIQVTSSSAPLSIQTDFVNMEVHGTF